MSSLVMKQDRQALPTATRCLPYDLVFCDNVFFDFSDGKTRAVKWHTEGKRSKALYNLPRMDHDLKQCGHCLRAFLPEVYRARMLESERVRDNVILETGRRLKKPAKKMPPGVRFSKYPKRSFPCLSTAHSK
ncbi:MAG: hypothetical protein L0387_12420 [Acidobacteria bacterium]|nr:hypothetical protein [Acidobacteriota bacterium]MCI0622445.1 hypothetical protein [Acidobacteriota bacterium]MCI0722363.1 hypothetical protein [Acidobacteriota bacterium]